MPMNHPPQRPASLPAAKSRWHFPGVIKRLLTTPVDELTRWQRAIRYALELAYHCAGELRHDKAGQMAAALTYHTLFSLLPMAVLILIGLNTFVSDQKRQEFKETVVTWAVEGLQGNVDPAPSEIGQERQQELLAVRDRLDVELEKGLQFLEGVDYKSIGVVGILLFIWAATGLLGTVENSFNDIYGSSSGRPWYLRLPLYYTVISLGPLVVLAGQWVQGHVIGFIQTEAWTNWLVSPVAAAIPVLAMWLVIFLMYVLLPNTMVSKKAATVGSFVAAMLLLAARMAFSIYVSRTVLTSLYGALALLPLFLLVLFWMWLTVLFGLELTYTLDAMRDQEFKRERFKSHATELLDAALFLPLALKITRAFRNGLMARPENLRQEMGLPQPVILKMLNALEGEGFVYRVVEGPAFGYVLARPPETIRAGDVLRAGRRALAPEVRAPRDPDLKWIEESIDKSPTEEEQATLAQLVERTQ
jgi:membrane protein